MPTVHAANRVAQTSTRERTVARHSSVYNGKRHAEPEWRRYPVLGLL